MPLQPADSHFDAKHATITTTDTTVEADAPTVLAVSYLRVSSREPGERGSTDEGLSFPAGREANARKATELGAKVVREYVDARESARSADPDGLQEVLTFIAATQVAFCVVHKLDRLPRNRGDHVKITKLSSLQASPWCQDGIDRPDVVGDARSRDHVIRRRVLQPHPRNRNYQGHAAMSPRTAECHSDLPGACTTSASASRAL